MQLNGLFIKVVILWKRFMKAFPHHKKNSAIPYAGACYKIYIYSRPKQAFV